MTRKLQKGRRRLWVAIHTERTFTMPTVQSRTRTVGARSDPNMIPDPRTIANPVDLEWPAIIDPANNNMLVLTTAVNQLIGTLTPAVDQLTKNQDAMYAMMQATQRDVLMLQNGKDPIVAKLQANAESSMLISQYYALQAEAFNAEQVSHALAAQRETIATTEIIQPISQEDLELLQMGSSADPKLVEEAMARVKTTTDKLRQRALRMQTQIAPPQAQQAPAPAPVRTVPAVNPTVAKYIKAALLGLLAGGTIVGLAGLPILWLGTSVMIGGALAGDALQFFVDNVRVRQQV